MFYGIFNNNFLLIVLNLFFNHINKEAPYKKYYINNFII